MTITRSYCRLCIAQCGILVHHEDGNVVDVRGDPDHSLSRGYICPKGRAIGVAHHDPRRLNDSSIGRPPDRRVVAAAEMLDDLAARLTQIIEESGADAVGVYSGTATGSDRAGYTAFARLRAALGTKSAYSPWSIDSIAKPAATQMMSGFTMVRTHVDEHRTKLTILVGANPVVSHGHLWGLPDPVRRLRELASEGEVWVLDPRRSETAQLATRHVAPRVATDYALFAHLVRELLEDGADHDYIDAHTMRVDDLRAAVAPFTEDRVAELSGVAPSILAELVAAVRRAGRVAILTGTGSLFTASAAVTEWLVWATLLVTGSLDRPGGTVCKQDFFAPTYPDPFVPLPSEPAPGPPSRPELPSWRNEYPVAALSDEVETGRLRALVIAGGNPMIAFPDHERTARAMRSLEVLAVADVIDSDMTTLATHVMACTGLLERADTSSSVAQIANYGQYTPAVLQRGPGRHPMWWYLAQLARRLGHDIVPGDPDALRDEDVLMDVCTSDEGHALIASRSSEGVTEEIRFGWLTDIATGHPWDLAPPALVERLRVLPEPPPLALLPRRQLRHTNSTLRDVPAPGGRVDEVLLFMNPHDAEDAHLMNGARALVTSRSGSLTATVRLDPELARGGVALPHGYADVNVCRLTSGDLDGVEPLSGMTIQSGIAVSVAPVSPSAA